MKSIIEEAPSILKAIEKAWARAGNPTEFSVKIFEEAQKNFFGMTSKNAKVGVFFEIEPIRMDALSQSGQNSKEENKHKKPLQTPQREQLPPRQHAPRIPHEAHSYPEQKSVPRVVNNPPHTEDEITQENGQERKKRIAWNDEMLTAVSMWLKDLLTISNLGSHQPTLTVLDNRLIILFATPLFEDPTKASDLYRSLSYLLIGMIRSKFKKEFRFLKVVLTDNSRDRDNHE